MYHYSKKILKRESALFSHEKLIPNAGMNDPFCFTNTGTICTGFTNTGTKMTEYNVDILNRAN